MARGGINKAVVERARQALLARGEHPSIDAVRVELGNTGSKTTIHRYLRELDEQPASIGRTDKPLGDQLSELVGRLAERLEEEAQATVAEERAQLARDRLADQQRRQDAEDRIRQLAEQAEALAAHLQAEQQAHQTSRDALQQLHIEQARAQQASEDLLARLADRDAQIRSLEEKHQHARDALQHYREASKEQREQEQRRHESQVQQLQMEIRQLQQTLIVKQDELTRLNRDNERLLGEAGQLRRESHARQDTLQRQSSELAGVKENLTQAITANQVLQVRLEAQQTAVQRLEAGALEHQHALAGVQGVLHAERLQFHQLQAVQRQREQSLRALLARTGSAIQATDTARIAGSQTAAIDAGVLLGWLSEAQSLLEAEAAPRDAPAAP